MKAIRIDDGYDFSFRYEYAIFYHDNTFAIIDEYRGGYRILRKLPIDILLAKDPDGWTDGVSALRDCLVSHATRRIMMRMALSCTIASLTSGRYS